MRALILVLLLSGCGAVEDGRYNVVDTGRIPYLIDTRTGCVWMLAGQETHPIHHLGGDNKVDQNCPIGPTVEP